MCFLRSLLLLSCRIALSPFCFYYSPLLISSCSIELLFSFAFQCIYCLVLVFLSFSLSSHLSHWFFSLLLFLGILSSYGLFSLFSLIASFLVVCYALTFPVLTISSCLASFLFLFSLPSLFRFASFVLPVLLLFSSFSFSLALHYSCLSFSLLPVSFCSRLLYLPLGLSYSLRILSCFSALSTDCYLLLVFLLPSLLAILLSVRLFNLSYRFHCRSRDPSFSVLSCLSFASFFRLFPCLVRCASLISCISAISLLPLLLPVSLVTFSVSLSYFILLRISYKSLPFLPFISLYFHLLSRLYSLFQSSFQSCSRCR